MARVATLPARTLGEVHAAYPVYRQSLLGTADNCLLSARFDIEGKPYTNAAQARGILFHRVAAEILRTLRATGEVQMPVAEALEVMYEVCAQRDVAPEDIVVCPMRERRLLRIAVVMFAGNRLNMSRLIDVERRLFTTVSYVDADGTTIERTITGQPDALIADPPNGAVVLDFKTTPSPPPKGDGTTKAETDDGGDHAHVSYEGYFQQRTYALLVLRNYPSVETVTLREFYVLASEAREATVTRASAEHIERELADTVALLDRALVDGSKSPLWEPSPGLHCNYCRRPSSCPIEGQARVKEGGIASDAEAARVAAEFVLVDLVRTSHRKALKARVDATGRSIPVKAAKGRYELGWRVDGGGRRKFGMSVPEASDRGAEDPALKDAFREAKARKAAA